MEALVIGVGKPKGGSMELCLPSQNLAVEGVEPENGDEVEFTVKGKVSRAEGGFTYVTPSMVNGEPVAASAKKEEPAEPKKDESEESFDSLMEGAKKKDEEEGLY